MHPTFQTCSPPFLSCLSLSTSRDSELNFSCHRDVSVATRLSTLSNFSTLPTSQSFCRQLSSPTSTSSVRCSTASSRVTSSCLSSESGKSMTWLATLLPLVDWLTTSRLPRISSIFREIPSTLFSTPYSLWEVVPFSLEFGSMCLAPHLVMFADNLCSKI